MPIPSFTEGNPELVLEDEETTYLICISNDYDAGGSWVMLGKQRPKWSEIKHASI